MFNDLKSDSNVEKSTPLTVGLLAYELVCAKADTEK